MNHTRCLLLVALLSGPAWAQQGQNLITVPSVGVTDSFYEHYGVGWGINRMRPNGSGWFFNNGGGSSATIPAFGGFDGSGARFGAGFPGGGFNVSAAQGSSRSIVGQSASVMVPNGGGGSIFSGSMRPFVTGIVPVVGAAGPPRVTSPLQLKLEQMKREGTTGTLASSADDREEQEAPLRLSGDRLAPPASTTAAEAPRGSLSDLKRVRAAEVAREREEARQHIVVARKAESGGKLALARSEYLLAIDLVTRDDPWHGKILDRLAAIRNQ